MAKINSGSLRNWSDGDVMHEVDYEKERTMIVTALNDTDDRVTNLAKPGGIGTTNLADNAVTSSKVASGVINLTHLEPTLYELISSSPNATSSSAIIPDRLKGTDAQKVQKAIEYALINRVGVEFDRIYNITGSTITIDKSLDNRIPLRLFSNSNGGIRKTDAGYVFVGAATNTGDIFVDGLTFESLSGAGTKIYKCPSLIRVQSNQCSYLNVDTVAYGDGYYQSMRFHNETITGGKGAAFDFGGAYDTTWSNLLIEHREHGILHRAVGSDPEIYNCRVRDCCLEGLSGTAIQLQSCNNLLIDGNYFEWNTGGHIKFFGSFASTKGLTISNNRHSGQDVSAFIEWGGWVLAVSFSNISQHIPIHDLRKVSLSSTINSFNDKNIMWNDSINDYDPISIGPTYALKVISPQGYKSVVDFGAVGDGTVENTDAISLAFDSIITGGTIYFPKGVYILKNLISRAFTGPIHIKADPGAVIKFTGPIVQNVFKFVNATHDITIEGLEIDASYLSAMCLWIQNASADMTKIANIKFINCTFRNGFQRQTTLFSSGVYVRGGFKSVHATGCKFIDFDSMHDSPVVHGMMIGQENGIDNWTKEVVITDCLIEDIMNATDVDSDGLAYFTNYTDGVYHDGALIVKGSTFRNCKGRSIKSQVQQNTITGNRFYRDKYNGNAEIDIQYSGATVSNNVFYSKGFKANTVIGASVRDTIHSAFTVSDNEFIFDGVVGESVISSTVTTLVPLRGISVSDNKVRGQSNYFLTLRIAEIADNFVYVTGNSIEKALIGWLNVYKWGDGSPVLGGYFAGNEHYKGAAVNNVIQGCKLLPDVWQGNKGLGAGGGGPFINRTYADIMRVDNPLTINIPWKGIHAAVKVTCCISYANPAESTYHLALFEAWVQTTVNGLIFTNKVEQTNAAIGSWSVTQNADKTGLTITKAAGTEPSWCNYFVTITGSEMQV